MEIFKSRTILTVLLTLFIANVQLVAPFLSPEQYTLLVSILMALAGYFRINARQEF
jgi:hypothetical protein